MPRTVYLNFYQGSDPQSANRFMALCTQVLQQYQPQILYILFSSGERSVDSVVTLYNFLRGLPCKIVTHNIGSIDSLANAVFLAGKHRYATPNSAFLFHGVTWGFAQGANLTYPQLQKTLSRFDAAEQLFAGILVDRTEFQAEQVRELFRQDESRHPSFAKSKGVIHEIKDFSIEPGAPVFSVPA